MELDYLDDPEFQELIRQYIRYLAEVLPTLKTDLQNNDFLKIQKFGHNLKGSGGGYGLAEMSTIGQMIEAASKEQDHEELSNLLTRFQTELETAQKRFPPE